MLKKIKTSQLKIGMYIHLSSAWYSHPFFSSHFTITSQKQIQKLLDCGIREINIDESKGLPATADPAKISVQAPVEQPEEKDIDNLAIATAKLEETLADKSMAPEERAEAIHVQTVEIVRSVWDNPAAEKIAEFKKCIFAVVDTLLADKATHNHLLKLTSHNYNTYIHSVNVGFIAISLANTLLRKGDSHNLHALGAGFFLHDLGKIQVDESIIQKPGKLSDEEMAIMKKHPSMGLKLLMEAKQTDEESKLIIMHHHERFDGSGYPQGLRANDIHLYGKICSVADVFDALVSKRPFKNQVKPFEALRIIREEMFEQYNKEIFEKFVRLFIS